MPLPVNELPMGDNPPAPSPDLLAANDRLLALRRAAGIYPSRPSPLAAAASMPESSSPPPYPIPPHLGWESQPVTEAIRRACEKCVEPIAAAAADPGGYPGHFGATEPSQPIVAAVAGKSPPHPPPAPTFKLYPSLALALLRREQVACGRIWLLLRHLDKEGRGWLPPDQVRQELTSPVSPLYLCGGRQLRKLLAQGEGLFWQRDEGHLWLFGLVRVAAALGVARLSGKPVALPLKVLLDPIGDVRAHLYASFHSGRTKTERSGSQSSPISRATLTDLSGVSPRSQQTYERKADVTVKRNLAVGSPVGAVCPHNQVWQHGRAHFTFTDFRGRQGKAGESYHAWQLPNNYFGPHAHLSRGRVRHHNRQLADLRHKGDAGNGQRSEMVRRYFGNGCEAEKGWRKRGRVPVYWPGKKERQGVVLWWVMEEPV